MPLPDPLQKIAEETLGYFSGGSAGAPYLLYVYEPEAELAVRKEMLDLVAYLKAHGSDVAAVSLADLFWQAVDDSGFYQQMVEVEKENPDDSWALEKVHETLREILTSPPTLADRVMTAVEDTPDHCAVILYRAAALYPVFRTSALLDDLRDRLRRPVLLLYPGQVVEPYGLKFMARCEPIHGYRAKIFQRSSA
ncbi:MAG: DUF1788 domain-containing protein [Actinomycetota bacterium]|nr:DUF1788 domain-containing protein [Actinomycetota bacterium]